MRSLRLVHAWCGIVLALLVALIGLSGAFSSVRAEFVRLKVPAARALPSGAMTYGSALNALEMARPGELAAVRFSPYGMGVHQVQFKDGRRAFIDGQGKVVSQWRPGARLEEMVLSLHHTLLLGEAGRILVSLIGVAVLAMGVTGLILAWPQLHTVSLSLWPRSLERREIVAAHRNLAVIFGLFIMLQVFSGVFVNLAPEIGAVSHRSRERPDPKAGSPPAEAFVDWHQIFVSAQDGRPAFRIRRAFAPQAPDEAYRVYISPPRDLSPKGSLIVFLDWQGRVLERRDERSGAWERTAETYLFALHSGDLGPAWMRMVTGFIGLVLALLALVGAWGWATYLLRGERLTSSRRREPA